jgi:uncharacterized protein (TIGR02466 family)
MKEPKIATIFPTPIYLSNINRVLTETEKKFVDKCKTNTYKNEGNATSLDTYVLNNVELKEIKKSLDLAVKDYCSKILSITDSVTPYITQSWLSYTETNQYHHRHSHAHSLVSGVFYIKCNKELDRIDFHKRNDDVFFCLEAKEYNIYNSSLWWLPINTGDIVLFPSSLTHGVSKVKSSDTRISLAFNVFVKGTIGDKQKNTELVL